MIENKILLATPHSPRQIYEIFNENKEFITKMTIVSVDFPPLEIKLHGSSAQPSKSESIFGKKQDQVSMYDVAGIIVEVSPLHFNEKFNLSGNKINQKQNQEQQMRKIFVVAKDVAFVSHHNKKMVSINGKIDILPEEIISKIYVNFPELKSVNLEEMEEILSLTSSKKETATQGYGKLGTYFTAQNYEINNNILNLIEHQEKTESISKKVILKKMVAYEIRK